MWITPVHPGDICVTSVHPGDIGVTSVHPGDIGSTPVHPGDIVYRIVSWWQTGPSVPEG